MNYKKATETLQLLNEIKLISIVITFNGSQWIKRCLDSLINSEQPNQIIVIDNKSIDSTKDIIKSDYPQVQLIESEENLGFGRANNIGLKIALDSNADYVFLLNQDAWVEPNTLEKLIAVQLVNKEYGVISPIHLTGDGKLLDDYFSRYLFSSRIGGFELISKRVINSKVKNIYPIEFVNAAAWLISRECLDTVGGFDQLFVHYAEDNNYLDRLRYHGFKVGVIPDAIIYHDRQNRKNSNWKNPFHREQDIFRRSLLINSLNPNQPMDSGKIIKYLKLNVFKSFFKLNMKTIRLQINILKEYSYKTDEIQKHLERSKQKGRTYLK